jgi:Tol biopolymer transport system component
VAQVQDAQSLAWTSDGKLLVSDGQGVRRMNPDGGQQTMLMNDPNSWIVDMARCGDRYLLLSWAFHGGTNRTGIWRVNADGSNPTQLTKGTFDYYPMCSPDGKWAYYFDVGEAHPLMRVRLEGGDAEPVPSTEIHRMFGIGAGWAISPDGKLLAFNAELTAVDNPQSAVSKLALVSLDSSSQAAPRLLEPDRRIAGGAPFTNNLSFTPDGRSLAYIVRDQGVDNVWVQPLDGSAGHRITNFTSDNIAEFRWSPDGKSLAVARMHNTSDVVLLREK